MAKWATTAARFGKGKGKNVSKALSGSRARVKRRGALTRRPIVRTVRAMASNKPPKDKKIPVRVDAERHAKAYELADHLGYGTVSAMMRAWLYSHLADFEKIQKQSRRGRRAR